MNANLFDIFKIDNESIIIKTGEFNGLNIFTIIKYYDNDAAFISQGIPKSIDNLEYIGNLEKLNDDSIDVKYKNSINIIINNKEIINAFLSATSILKPIFIKSH